MGNRAATTSAGSAASSAAGMSSGSQSSAVERWRSRPAVPEEKTDSECTSCADKESVVRPDQVLPPVLRGWQSSILRVASQAAAAGGCIAYQHSGCPLNRRYLFVFARVAPISVMIGRLAALPGRSCIPWPRTTRKSRPSAFGQACPLVSLVDQSVPCCRQQQDDMKQFMVQLGRVYPCGFVPFAWPADQCALFVHVPRARRYCADRTSDEIEVNPPRVASQQEFAQWMCELHNEVNFRMNKPIFDCSKVAERWRTGPSDGSCS